MENCCPKTITNEQFNRLMTFYFGTFLKWHSHIKKYIKIDRETFLSEFQIVLFNAMRKFDVDKATAEDARFDRYFMTSLRHMVNTLLRKAKTTKTRINKNSVSFCLRKHDIADKTYVSPLETMSAINSLEYHFDGIDRQIILARMHGYSKSEIITKFGEDECNKCKRKINFVKPIFAAV